MPNDVMNIKQTDVEMLQHHYDIAVKEKKETFFFLGHELVTNYGKYLLEYAKEKYGLK